MATHQINILGPNTTPDTSGNVYLQNYTEHATNDVWGINVFVFEDSGTRIGIRGSFVIPQNYVGTPVIIPIWTTAATSGDVEWDFDYRAVGGDDAESLDQSGTQESVNINDTAPSAAHERLAPTGLTLTAGNLAAGDTVLFEFFRDGTDAGDTLSDEALLFNLMFQYADA
jgi:hypothetical protein